MQYQVSEIFFDVDDDDFTLEEVQELLEVDQEYIKNNILTANTQNVEK